MAESTTQLHASCVARGGFGVLLLGPSGAGKSDLALRLIDRGFTLVADDRVDLADLEATPPPALAGLLEVRGLGIMRLPWTRRARLVLAVALGAAAERLPNPAQHPLGIPLITVDPRPASAPQLVTLALDCVLGHARQMAGAFTSAEPAP